VLVPLTAVAFAGLCWRPSWRAAYTLPVALLGVIGAVFSFLAKESGGPLERGVRDAAGERLRFGEHPEQGDTAFFFALVLGVTVVAFWALNRWRDRLRLPPWAPNALFAAALLPAVAATFTMVVAGHSGAQLVWKDLGSFAAGK